ncbi:MAG: NADH-quinone oxidoreductase subunit J [Bacteroidetes bacterium]|nr:NADH-quinone oxidoreductase subunit J [Bacteroidota bacterium]
MISTYIFYFLSFVAVFSALLVITSKNPIYSVLYLVVTFFSIAGHYVLLNAQFLAAVHVIVYAGAIMVLFLFVIMLLNLNEETETHKPALVKFAGVISGGLLLLVLVAALKNFEMAPIQNAPNPNIGLIKNIGKVLFGEFMVPFEVSSILFLGAMVGAVMLGKKEIK